MNYYFEIALVVTFLLTRIFTHTFHDYENPENYNKNTLTGHLREASGLEIHHFHFGLLILLISLILYYFLFYISLTQFKILLGISLSLIFDQILPIFNLLDYFEFTSILFAISFHLFLLIFSILLQNDIF